MVKGYTHLQTLKEPDMTAQRQRQIEDIYKKYDPKLMEMEMISGQNASNKRQIDQLQDQLDYIRGEFKSKLTNKEANSDNFINTHSELQLEETDNIYSYLDSKITNLHAYLNTEYVLKIQNLIKIETSKLGEEIASDINLIEKRMADQKTEFEIWEDTSKKAMFSLEAMIEQKPSNKKPSVPRADNSRS